MEWWQILLAVLASLGIGMLLGILLNRLIKRFTKKHKLTLVVEEQMKYTPPDLIEEIESNRKIAIEPKTDKLLSFQTHVWDVLQDEVNKLPTNLKEELVQVYLDIRLANSIVWLSTEFGRRSPNLDGSYMKVCTTIADRIDRLKPLINPPEVTR